MIAPDHDWRFDFSAPNEFVDGDTKFRALAIAKPADASGQSLKVNPFFCQLHPARENFVFRKEFERKLVGARDVLRITAQRDPAKRTFPFAKKRPDVLRNKPRNVESIFDAGFFRLGANV